ALDILPHCTKSAQKKVIVKAHIYSRIYSHIQIQIKTYQNQITQKLTKLDGSATPIQSAAGPSSGFKGPDLVCKQSQLPPETKHKKNAQNIFQLLRRHLRKFVYRFYLYFSLTICNSRNKVFTAKLACMPNCFAFLLFKLLHYKQKCDFRL
ncbi:hypothetical protein, partial [Thiolapillus sp.]|uniref:hypothetical protein n=1 Tax=Thiolapillus sp. TaxID=2017437 RepID=UPI003AF4598C